MFLAEILLSLVLLNVFNITVVFSFWQDLTNCLFTFDIFQTLVNVRYVPASIIKVVSCALFTCKATKAYVW